MVLSALQERTPVTVGYKTELPGQPKGEYVTVIFASKFAKAFRRHHGVSPSSYRARRRLAMGAAASRPPIRAAAA